LFGTFIHCLCWCYFIEIDVFDFTNQYLGFLNTAQQADNGGYIGLIIDTRRFNTLCDFI